MDNCLTFDTQQVKIQKQQPKEMAEDLVPAVDCVRLIWTEREHHKSLSHEATPFYPPTGSLLALLSGGNVPLEHPNGSVEVTSLYLRDASRNKQDMFSHEV
ncbi:hypothetical protein NQZ68_026763 [Dissostichus eleginoides]|nr:hypothetical protein NQZ68_026763 [Dissostichus eleginoides]